MLNKRVQTLFDQATWQLVHESAINMGVSFGEAIRQAANYAFKTKKIHDAKTPKSKSLNKAQKAIQEITKMRKKLNIKMSIEEILEMRHYGHKY